MDPSLFSVVTPILLMALFGVPHGGLDAALIKMTIAPNRQVFTFGIYIAIALLCIMVWYALPTVAMVLFLALSCWHFGKSDIVDQNLSHPLLHILARGGIWTLFLPLIHWSTTEPIFAQLRTDTELIKIGLSGILPLWALGFCALIYVALATRTVKSLAVPVLALALVPLLPPLWSLGLYFCFWHARRHTQQTVAQLSDKANARRLSYGITAITLGIALMVFTIMPAEISLDTAIVRIFFVGIFALTVPHMILIDYYLPRTYSLGTHL